MNFVACNAAYEAWLRTQCSVDEDGLRRKHKRMARSAFDFLRATCFRWAKGIATICPALSGLRPVPSAGDLHVENFGTWRDVEGRLVWGVNDFDEAALIPFAYDLVRLATSIRMAPDHRIDDDDAAEALLEGYREGLRTPRPTLLDEYEPWLRPLVDCSDDERAEFWKDVRKYPDPNGAVPDDAAVGLQAALPDGARIERYATRQKGGGGLGRPRYLVIALWRGGHIVREAKTLVPSAWDWARGQSDGPGHFERLVQGRYRAPDPYLRVHGNFIIRRLAPDARKVEFETDPNLELRRRLIEAMGFDLGAIHADADVTAQLLTALDRLPAGWLQHAGRDAANWVEDDYREWCRSRE